MEFCSLAAGARSAAGLPGRRDACLPGLSGAEVFVDIPRGTSTEGMAALLAKAGVIRSRWDFWLRAWSPAAASCRPANTGSRRRPRRLRCTTASPAATSSTYELVVPEGKNMFDIAAAAEQLGPLPGGRIPGRRARSRPRFATSIRKLPRSKAISFPRPPTQPPHHAGPALPHHDRQLPRGLAQSADTGRRARNRDAGVAGGKGGQAGRGAPAHRRGVREPAAHRHEARLRPDHHLRGAASDDRYRGTIYRSDLDSDNPYNTYRHVGLPPGPIANPGHGIDPGGAAAGRSDALYFVLRPDGSGGHQFSNNIAAHRPPPRSIAMASRSSSVKQRGARIPGRGSRPRSPKPCGAIC